MRLTSPDESSSSRTRDEVDFGFEEIDGMALDDVEMEQLQQQERQQHLDRSSRTPFSEYGDMNVDESDADYIAEEVTESFDDSTNDDEFDTMVTRGRSKRQPAKPTKDNKKERKEKQKKTPTTRQTRTTRAASVRF